jgi:adenylosuccinate synthase
MARGANRHGSCGIGVGETFEDSLTHPEICIRAGDLIRPGILRQKTQAIRDLKRDQIITFCKEHSYHLAHAREFEAFEGDDLIDDWIRTIFRIGELELVAPDSMLEGWLRETDNVIFEGAQGVLLDAEAGFHPHTTWSNCTAANAMELINEMAPGAQVHRIGVTRAYAVRHGAGPLPTETEPLARLVCEHNQNNEWQGAVRYGWFDAVLTRYALRVTGGVDTLAVTHMDILQRLEKWKYCSGYRGPHVTDNTSMLATISDGLLTDFRLPPDLSLAKRTQFTQALSKAVPVLNNCSVDEEAVVDEIERLTGQQIGMLSYGPRAENVQVVNPFL